MRTRVITIFSLLVIAILATGCSQTTKDYWKTTKSYYHEYVNKPATIDMDNMGVYSPGEEVLAENLPPLEKVLERFKRTLFNLDKAPSDNWMYAFVTRFPWISGVAMVNLEGEVLHQWPTVAIKQYDFSFITEREKNFKIRQLLGHAEDSPLGPEVYMATQIMEKAQPAGYFIVHFDPRALFAHVYGSADFMVAAPGALLWPGKYDAATTPVAETDWEKVARSNSSGVVQNSHGKFVWYAIMMGDMPMVFAAPDEGNFPVVPGQMELLSTFQGVDSGEAISSAMLNESAEREPGTQIMPNPKPSRTPDAVYDAGGVEPGQTQVTKPPTAEGMAPPTKPTVPEEDVEE